MSRRARSPKNPVEPPEDYLPGGSTFCRQAEAVKQSMREMVEWATNALKPRRKKMTLLKSKDAKSEKAKVKARAPKNRDDDDEIAEDRPRKKKLKLLKKRSSDDGDDDSKAPRLTVNLGRGIVKSLSQFASMTAISVMKDLRSSYRTDQIAGAAEMRGTCVGIPLPFALEWLLQANVFPLGRVIQIVGKTGSNKSSLAFELIRLMAKYDGIGYLYENESKFNAELALSIVGYPPSPSEEKLFHVECKSCDDWQKKLSKTTERLVEIMRVKSKHNRNPLGCLYPVGLIIDSVMGKLSTASNEDITKRGHGDRKHPDEAMKITYFLKKYAADIANYPFTLILVNHLKIKKIEGTSATERIKTGGQLIDFQESVELECKKIADINRVNPDKNASLDAGGNRINIKCAKNSYGQTNRSLNVDLLWVDKMIDGELRQYSYFDWASAAVDILIEYQTKRRGAVRNVVDINSTAEGSKFYSQRLGIGKKEPVSKSVLGGMITSNKEMRRELRRLLGIKRYTAFKPGTDFHELKRQLKKKYEASADRA